jgi:parallel beta-helix repeat protein
MAIEVVSDNEDLQVLGSPKKIDLQVDIGGQGPAGTLQINEVTTLPAGSNANVTNVGSPTNAILNLALPRGNTGPKGDKGDTGDVVIDPVELAPQIKDVNAPTLAHSNHTNITATYNSNTKQILLNVPGILNSEQIQDIVGPMFAHTFHNNGASASYDDPNNRIVISSSIPSYETITIPVYDGFLELPDASLNLGRWAYNSSAQEMYYSNGSEWIEIYNLNNVNVLDIIGIALESATKNNIDISYDNEFKNFTFSVDEQIIPVGTANEIDVVINSGSATIGIVDSPTIAGSLTVGQNLFVNGSLTVSGSATTLNTTNLDIKDNIIRLNSGVTGTPTLNAGIEIERGTSPDVLIRWNESSDRWQFTNDGSTYFDFVTTVGETKQTNFYDVVRDYGAIPNETDSRAKIQNALNAARDANGGIVYIPSGLWNLSGGLRIYSNTHLMLSPRAYMRKLFAGASMLWNGDNGANYSGYDGQINITVTGGTWDARGTAFPTTPENIFSFAHSQNLTFRDITFRDVSGYHAIEINSTKTALVQNCRFLGFVNSGDRGFSEAVQIDGAFRDTLFGEFGSYDKTVCQDITIDRCYFGPSGFAGTTSWPNGVGSHSADTSGGSVLTERWHSDIKVTNNTFEGMTEWAVRSDAVWREAIISKNIFRQCFGGVALGFKTRTPAESWHVSFNFTITDNIFQEGKPGGLDCIMARNIDGIVISNNHFRPSPGTGTATGRNGIYITESTEGNIFGNRFEWVEENGIWIQNSSEIMISNNVIKNVSSKTNNTFSYILLNTGTNCSIIANRGYKGSAGNTALYGIRITNSTGTRGFGNNFGLGSTNFLSGTITETTANS